MPVFSVLVPIYKVEKYVCECIESILNQTFPDFELILVDDGSPDACPQICDEYAARDARIRVIHKENAGLVAARKSGVNAATGQYIINVDGDDYIENDLFQRLNEVIERESPDMIAFDYTRVEENGERLREGKNLLPEGMYQGSELKTVFQKVLFDYDMGDFNGGNILYNIWAKAVKRDILREYQNRVPDCIQKAEDVAVVMPMLTRDIRTLYVLHCSSYHYRWRGSSMVVTFCEADMENIFVLCKFLREEISEEVPVENLSGFLYSMVVWILTDSVTYFHSYRDFCNYCSKWVNKDLDRIFSEVPMERLIPVRKLQLWVHRKHKWMLYWLWYRNHSKIYKIGKWFRR